MRGGSLVFAHDSDLRGEPRAMNSGLVMYEEEFRLIAGICDRLTRDANAKVVFLVDKNGQLIASSGQAQNLDTTSLASDRKSTRLNSSHQKSSYAVFCL